VVVQEHETSFHPQRKETSLSETANLNNITFNGPIRVDASTLSPKVGKRSSFWNNVFLEQWMMDMSKNSVIQSTKKEFKDKLFFTLHHTKTASSYLKT
jgi:hypothetical protein